MGTITRTVDVMMGELDHDLQIFCSRRDFETCLKALEEAVAAGRRSRVQALLADLFEMMDNAGIEYEFGKPLAYYSDLVKNASLPDFSDYESRVLHSLFRQFQNFPSPSQYLERLVRQYSSPDDHWEMDPLRLQILKQFIKYGNCLSDAGFGGRMAVRSYIRQKTGKSPDPAAMADQIDDGIFQVLETADKTMKKPQGKYGLLKLADDLANERFRLEGATRQALYLFAMVYNMRFEPYMAVSAEEAASCDLEKDLFRDYYANNLMRWLSDSYRSGMTEFEVDPTGMGINFKNFAEVIYLYYLTTDYSPAEKIRRSSSMIQTVIDETGKATGERDLTSVTTMAGTGEYRSRILGDFSRYFPGHKKFQELSEEELKNLLLTHYDTSVWRTSKKSGALYRIGEMQVMNTQNGAWKEYKKLLERLDNIQMKAEDCSYGLWFTDVDALQNSPSLSDLEPEQKESFLKVLGAADSYLKSTLNASCHPLKITSSERVTRSALLFAYYYWFNEYYIDEEEFRRIPFGTFFQYFKNGMGDESSIDEIFEASGYQPLSGRNIIDVLTAFSSYVYLNS